MPSPLHLTGASRAAMLMLALLAQVMVLAADAPPGLAPNAPSGNVDEPSAASCQAAVARARSLVDTLAADDLSRRVAESHLVQARVEAGNGEFDDCLEFAERAVVEVREHRHRLLPGESLDVRRAR